MNDLKSVEKAFVEKMEAYYATKLNRKHIPQIGKEHFRGKKSFVLPIVSVSGTGGYNRNGVDAFTKGSVKIEHQEIKATIERSVEYSVDSINLSDSGNIATLANVLKVHLETEGVPIKKRIYVTQQWKSAQTHGATNESLVSSADLDTGEKVMDKIFNISAAFDDKDVPVEGRFLEVPTKINTLIKKVKLGKIKFSAKGDMTLDLALSILDGFTIISKPQKFLNTNFDNSTIALTANGKDILMLAYQTSAIYDAPRYHLVRLWTAAQNSNADSALLQVREIFDGGIHKHKKSGYYSITET